jgi:Animal haem peroxidase
MKTVIASGKAPGRSPHGGGVRGADLSRRSSQFEGRFGRMFRTLPAAQWKTTALLALGEAMTSKPELDPDDPLRPGAALEDPATSIHDNEENTGIPAGYTYLGQFIDHDITFDPASSLQKQNDVDGLVDYRTPRLDLDSLYGRGPEDQPYMYEPDGKKFKLGRALFELNKPSNSRDLPRYDMSDEESPKRALIGDKRNDENVIVSQLHGAMMQFHNKMVDAAPTASFAQVQRLVRWHYQWIVVTDFLVKLCGKEVVHEILPHLGKNQPIWKNKPALQFYKPQQDAFMPIEFAAAAYRFGHSMVRPIYRLNKELNGGDDEAEATPQEEKAGVAGRFFIFAGVQERGLNGFDTFPKQWAIDWSLFFDIKGSGNRVGKERVQPSYKIDTSLVNPLGFLPEFSKETVPSTKLTIDQLQAKVDPKKAPANLAQRNLLRGMAMALPSGQDVARTMGLTPISDANLRICKAVIEEWDDPKTPNMDKFAGGAFAGSAPLWYYVLAEAQYEWSLRAKKPGSRKDAEPVTLGEVGKRIVAETLIGLLLADGHSFLRQAPNWTPTEAGHFGADFDMGKLIDFALS